MKSLGISISRNTLSAVVWEKNLLTSRLVCACAVVCREPFGTEDDAAALAAEIRREAGSLEAPAVLSLPPAWTFVREVELPVHDLPRAKALHLAEIEGTFPFDDEEIVSDVLPPAPGRPGHFLVFASRRPLLEKAASLFTGAGFRIERIIPEAVALFVAARRAGGASQGLILSASSDLVVIRLEGGVPAAARQFAAAVLEDPKSWPAEWADLLETAAAGDEKVVVTVAGEPPPSLAEQLGAAVRLALPPGIAPAAAIAFGAALLPWELRATGDFALPVSAVAESLSAQRRTRMRVTAGFAAAALLAAVSALLVAAWTEEKKAEKIMAQLRKELVEVFPGTPAGSQPVVQFREKIRALRRRQKETHAGTATFFERLHRVAQALPAKEKIVVTEILYDSGKLRIAGEAETPALAERFRSALRGGFGAEAAVTLESSAGRVGRSGVGYTIVIEPKEPADAS